MLRHETTRRVAAPLPVCLDCIADPEAFLSASRYTYTFKRLNGSLYEVVFRWRKLGITRFYKVRIRVARRRDGVDYVSTPDSEYPFCLSFTLEGLGDSTRVRVRAEMKAGLMADLLGRRDFASFIEELVDKGLVEMARRLAARAGLEARGEGASCGSCLLYDRDTGRCIVLGVRVEGGARPPCGGRDYLPVWVVQKRG